MALYSSSTRTKNLLQIAGLCSLLGCGFLIISNYERITKQLLIIWEGDVEGWEREINLKLLTKVGEGVEKIINAINILEVKTEDFLKIKANSESNDEKGTSNVVDTVKGNIRNELAGITFQLEQALNAIDQVRGDEIVKQKRKEAAAFALKIYPRLDAIKEKAGL